MSATDSIVSHAVECWSVGFDVERVTTRRLHQTVIAVHGSLDERIAPTLRRTIGRLALNESDRVLLDLRELRAIDQAGIQVVLTLHQRCMSAGTQLQVNLGHDLREMLMRSEAIQRACIAGLGLDAPGGPSGGGPRTLRPIGVAGH